MQRLIRRFKDETDTKHVNMHELARWAVAKGWPLPKPADPIDRLAREFASAAREEIRYDATTGKPYRANHAVWVTQGSQQLHFWIDIDDEPRPYVVKSLIQRREQMVGDGLQLTLDADHWNATHPSEEPIQLILDFTDDVEWRKNSPDKKKTG